MKKWHFSKVNKMWITCGLTMLIIVSTFFLIKPANAEPTYARLPSGDIVHNPITVISNLSQVDFFSNPLGCNGSIDYWQLRFSGTNTDYLGQVHWGLVNQTLDWQVTETYNIPAQKYDSVHLQIYDEFGEMCDNYDMNDTFTVVNTPVFGISCGFGGGDCEFTEVTKNFFNFKSQESMFFFR